MLVKKKFVRRAILPVLLILLAVILVSYFTVQRESKKTSILILQQALKIFTPPKQLLNTGWRILDGDYNYIREGIKNSSGKGLQLFTLPGNYWVMDTMRRFIKNTFVLAMPQEDFKAEVSLAMSDFADLNCPHQQAGIILLNDTGNLANNIRFSVEKGCAFCSTFYRNIF